MRLLRAFLFTTAATVLVAPLVPRDLTHGAYAQPAPPGPDLRVRVVPVAPPPMRHEVIIARPSRNQVWMKGHWHHDGSEWRWNDGRWSEPPARRARWVSPKYKKVHNGWQYVPGHWSTERVIYN